MNGDDIDASNQNAPNDEITAIETGMLDGFSHNLQAPGFRFDNAASLTIASGVVTITQGYNEIDTEGAAATDDLDTITIGVMSSGVAIGEGSVIILQSANASRVITVKNGTGNIVLLGGDFVMNSTSARLTLVYSGSNWVAVSRTQETGSWTPVLGGAGGTSGQSYAIQVGRWIKNGQLVTVQAYVKLSAKGTITGLLQIQGLPFTSLNTSNAIQGITVSNFNVWATNWIALGGYILPNTTAMQISGRQSAGTGDTYPTTSDVGNDSELVVSATYLVKS